MVLADSFFDRLILNAKSLIDTTSNTIRSELKTQIIADNLTWVVLPEENRDIYLLNLEENFPNRLFQIYLHPLDTFIERFSAIESFAKYIVVMDGIFENKNADIIRFLQQKKEEKEFHFGLGLAQAPALDISSAIWEFYFLNIDLRSSQTYNSTIIEINKTLLPVIGYTVATAFLENRAALEYAKTRLLNLAGYALELNSKDQYDEIIGVLNAPDIDSENFLKILAPIYQKIEKTQCFVATCNECNDACPLHVFPKETLAYFFRGRTFGKDKEKIILTGSLCNNCGICDKVCPTCIPIGSKYLISPVHLDSPE